jgi:hypothetical protein
MQKSVWWKIRHSLWMIFAFIWFINWTPFLYVGVKARKRKWIISSVVYLVTSIGPFFMRGVPDESPINDIVLVVFLISWLIGIVHAFVIRKEVLLIMATTEKLRDMELKVQVEKEYDIHIKEDENIFEEEVFQRLSVDDKLKLTEIDGVMKNIYETLRLIKAKSSDKDKFMIVGKFMDYIKEYEDALPVLAKNFEDGLLFVGRYSNIEREIKEFEQKVNKSEGLTKKTYEKALNEKRATLDEIIKIRSSLSESESKLYLILSVLQKIEAILEAAKLSQDFSNEEVNTLNSYLETFAENIKDTLKASKVSRGPMSRGRFF